MHSILNPLTDRYDIHYIGIGYKGPVQTGEMTVYPCNLRGGDVFGVYQAKEFIERYQPELVVLLNDLWILDKYPRVLAPYEDRTKIVCYCPLDGRVVDDSLIEPLASVSRLVVYTEFARRELKRAAARLSQARGTTSFPQIDVIPHGVDTAVFNPLAGSIEAQLADDGRLAARRRLFPEEPALHDAFIVLNANRPQPRKRIDLTIRGFAQFAHNKPPNIRLYLHHAVMGLEEREEIVRQAGAWGVTDRLILSPGSGHYTPDEELNLIYNACDVGINTTMGEGWGLVSFEHAATGAAQILPRHSAGAELWPGAAELLEPVDTCVPNFSLLELQTVSPEGVAAALERLYADQEYRKTMSLAAYRNATQPVYRWGRIATQWRGLFDELLDESETLAAPTELQPHGR
jgi:D-inositol-3-phosphate glycosyltransferase